MKKTLITTSLALALTGFGFAPAASADTVKSFSFTFEDWELETADSRADLFKRLDSEVEAYCDTATAHVAWDYRYRVANRCMSKVKATTIRRLGLKDYHQVRHDNDYTVRDGWAEKRR